MIVDSLKCRHAKENDVLPYCEAGQSVSHDCAERIQYEAFQRMVVESTERVWTVQPMVSRVDVAIEKFVDVHQPMPKILPCVQHESIVQRISAISIQL